MIHTMLINPIQNLEKGPDFYNTSKSQIPKILNNSVILSRKRKKEPYISKMFDNEITNYGTFILRDMGNNIINISLVKDTDELNKYDISYLKNLIYILKSKEKRDIHLDEKLKEKLL